MDRGDNTIHLLSNPMNRAASISDQFFAASEKFHAARDAYAAERQFLSELEQQLLKYTEDYQALPEQAEYVGDGTWREIGRAHV